MKKLPILSYFDSRKLFDNAKDCNNANSINEALMKNNLMLPPFNFNFLHLGAISGNFKEISNNQFDWSQFDATNVPLLTFNSHDFQGQTCIDIVTSKKDKNKSLLTHYLEVLFKAFENDFDLEYDNHFYQMLKFYSCQFNSGRGIFYNFLNQLLEIYGEDTKILGKFFDYMFIDVDKSLFVVISDRELEKPYFSITNQFSWLRDQEQVLKKISKIRDDGSLLPCLKRSEINQQKADVLCKIFLCKGATEVSNESLQFWENLLKIDPENSIFDNQNLTTLVQYKWDSFARFYYLKDLAVYLIFFLLYLINFIYLSSNRINDDNINIDEIISIIFDSADMIYFFIYAFSEMRQVILTGFARYFSSFWNLVDFIVILGVLSTTILDIIYISGNDSFPYSIKIIIAITLLFLWARLLSYSKGFEGTGFWSDWLNKL